MTELVKKQNGYRNAISVHLHDQRLIVSSDAYSFSTDSGWTDESSIDAEYLLSYKASTELERLVLGLTGQKVSLDRLGFSRVYAAYPNRGSDLKQLRVKIISDRMIDIQIVHKDDEYIENWTYSGSYTVRWDDEASDG